MPSLDGYELLRCLAPFFGAGAPLNSGLFSPALAKLERAGWVTKERVPQAAAPDRHVYAATAKGRREFLHWLEASETSERPIRYDFFRRDPLLVRVMFFGHLPPAQVRRILRAEVAAADARVRDYAQMRAGMTARGADRYRIRILEFGLRYHRLRRTWIKALLRDVEGRRPKVARPKTLR